MFDRKTIRDVELEGKHVLVRVDYNVPVEDGVVANDRRIRASIPTLRHLLGHGARPTLCSHLGRPGGEPDLELSLKPAAAALEELIDAPVVFMDDCIGAGIDTAVEKMNPGILLLLENTRFHPGEKKNDPELARQLARPHDLFVGDAFAAAHRAHASTVGAAEQMEAVAGFLMEREVEGLTALVEDPAEPFVGVLGGAKVGDKIGVIRRLMRSLDRLLVGGGMANTLLRARGVAVERSLIDEDSLGEAEALLEEFGDRIALPVDAVVAPEPDQECEARTVGIDNVPQDWRILDLGPETLDQYQRVLESAGTIVWNGPVGMFERDAFSAGTRRIGRLLARVDAYTVVGGGETGQALDRQNVGEALDHVSTGGGAFLEFLEGKQLPGLAVLEPRA